MSLAGALACCASGACASCRVLLGAFWRSLSAVHSRAVSLVRTRVVFRTPICALARGGSLPSGWMRGALGLGWVHRSGAAWIACMCASRSLSARLFLSLSRLSGALSTPPPLYLPPRAPGAHIAMPHICRRVGCRGMPLRNEGRSSAFRHFRAIRMFRLFCSVAASRIQGRIAEVELLQRGGGGSWAGRRGRRGIADVCIVLIRNCGWRWVGGSLPTALVAGLFSCSRPGRMSQMVGGAVASTNASSVAVHHSRLSARCTHHAAWVSRQWALMELSCLRWGPGRPWPPVAPKARSVIALHNPPSWIPPWHTLLAGYGPTGQEVPNDILQCRCKSY